MLTKMRISGSVRQASRCCMHSMFMVEGSQDMMKAYAKRRLSKSASELFEGRGSCYRGGCFVNGKLNYRLKSKLSQYSLTCSICFMPSITNLLNILFRVFLSPLEHNTLYLFSNCNRIINHILKLC